MIFEGDSEKEVVLKALRENIRMPEGHSFRVIRWENNLREIHNVLAGGGSELVSGEGEHWHYHAEMEMTWFQRGGGTRFVGDGIASFGAGELVLLGGNLPHCWHVSGNCAGISIQWDFPRGHAFWSFPESSQLRGLFSDAARGVLVSGSSAKVVAGMMKGMMEKPGVERLGGLFGILGHLAGMERGEGNMISAKGFSLSGKSAYREAMERVMRHIIANFRDDLPLEEILGVAAMSRATFSRQFRLHSGRSFSGFLLGLRLETACRELLETDRTVTEVAYGCGFGQISFFNRSFRKRMGCSPTEFRKNDAGSR